MKAIIVTGDPIRGFEFIGPFENVVAAATFGNQDANLDTDWWVAEIEAPTTYEIHFEEGGEA